MWYKNSTNEDDIIMFNIEVVTGNIAIAWFTGPNFGTANVWIDNDRNNSIKLSGHAKFRLTATIIAFRNVTPGYHYVNFACKKSFSVTAIASSV